MVEFQTPHLLHAFLRVAIYEKQFIEKNLLFILSTLVVLKPSW